MTQSVFYEEDGGFKVGAILADHDTSLQVEAPHGKRSKVKSSAVLFRFDGAGLGDFMRSEKSRPTKFPFPLAMAAAFKARSPVPVPMSRMRGWAPLSTARIAWRRHLASRRKLMMRLSRS